MSPTQPPHETSASPLSLRVLGPMELSHQGEPIALPRSKKCRALLGYLAVTGRSHRRERLCSLFWDVADDPRGALRWTLSRLRSVLPEGVDLFEADRTSVALRPGAIRVDANELAALHGTSLGDLESAPLEAAARLHAGELLEGLALPDFLDFTAWCVAEREQLRRTHCAVLQELVERHADEDTERALGWARHWAQADTFNPQAHSTLLRLLLGQGLREEAERRHAHAVRQLRQMAAPEAEALERTWRALRAGAVASANPHPAHVAPAAAPHSGPAAATMTTGHAAFVGRQATLATIRGLLQETREARRRAAVLLSAEPGGGKSRLLERLQSEAEHEGYRVLSARAFDLERGRPFGPWIDALGVAPAHLAETAQSGGRAQLFEQLETLVRTQAEGHTGVVLSFDDVQWLDGDSAEALHHLLQRYTVGPCVALLAARGGELPDNAAVERVLRSLRHDGTLTEVEVEPLSRNDVASLIADEGLDDATLDRITQASAGNPLYALELSRGALRGDLGATPTLVDLVRERVNRLSDAAGDALRWGAVLGYTFDAERLEALSELPQLELVDALEELERHALLRIDTTRRRERYTFSHDIVREAAYGGLSHPRKRLMHRKVARLLEAHASEAATAHEVARHASLAGEAELGVRACTAAAQYALRTCANGDAEALARRGLHLANELDEAARVEASLDLLHVLYSARTPDRAEASERVRTLAERALDLGLTKAARIGFQMLSYLRWESASMADAHANIMQAERVSRSAEPDERSQALAHAARCLVLLERNLGQAEAFLMEASGVAERSGHSSAAVAFAMAMIAAHRGEAEIAGPAFREAQDLARASGERLAELNALEHHLMLALDQGEVEEARSMATHLVALAARVRPGAEVAVARALSALVERVAGGAESPELAEATEALRKADAKFELSFVLTRWAHHALGRGDLEQAAALGEDALQVAGAIGRVSERVIATAVLASAKRAQGHPDAHGELLEGVSNVAEADLSAVAKAALQAARVPPS